jgi:hypothetical protein
MGLLLLTGQFEVQVTGIPAKTRDAKNAKDRTLLKRKMLRWFSFSENKTGCGDAALLLRKGSFAQRVCFRCVLLCREINRGIFGRQAPV